MLIVVPDFLELNLNFLESIVLNLSVYTQKELGKRTCTQKKKRKEKKREKNPKELMCSLNHMPGLLGPGLNPLKLLNLY